MDLREAKEVITRCVRKLPKRDRRRLNSHAERGTRILCGPDRSGDWIDKGKASICVLASTRRIPKKYHWSKERWRLRSCIMHDEDDKICDALNRISEQSLRKLLVKITP